MAGPAAMIQGVRMKRSLQCGPPQGALSYQKLFTSDMAEKPPPGISLVVHEFIPSGLVDRALVGQLGQVAGVDRDLEHVPDDGALALPGGEHVVDEPAGGHRLLEDAGR